MSDKKFVIIIIGVGLIFIALLVVFGSRSKEPEPELLGQEYKEEVSGHISAGDPPFTYTSNPPVSGPHDSQPADWGYYEQGVPDTKALHNLEHGGIWISYKPNVLSNEEINSLKKLAEKYDKRLIVSPRPTNDSNIAVASWTRLEKMESLDLEFINNFLTINPNNSPEGLAQ